MENVRCQFTLLINKTRTKAPWFDWPNHNKKQFLSHQHQLIPSQKFTLTLTKGKITESAAAGKNRHERLTRRSRDNSYGTVRDLRPNLGNSKIIVRLKTSAQCQNKTNRKNKKPVKKRKHNTTRHNQTKKRSNVNQTAKKLKCNTNTNDETKNILSPLTLPLA